MSNILHISLDLLNIMANQLKFITTEEIFASSLPYELGQRLGMS